MIKDSGNREVFASGAVRDIQEGKGRCDLLPLDVVAEHMEANGEKPFVIHFIHEFQRTGDTWNLHSALGSFGGARWGNISTMILEVAAHFEEGARKYAARNWEKGIPVQRFIDSGVRHYFKWLRGDTDEPHDRAFCWNMLCAIWTCKHQPELNEYDRSECDERGTIEEVSRSEKRAYDNRGTQARG